MTASRVTLSRYATHDASAYPQLWRGCVGAWAPCIGPSGDRLHDYSRTQNWATLTNMDPATDWVVENGAYALDFDGSNDYVVSSANIKDIGTVGALCAWAKFRTLNSGTHAVISLYYVWDYSIISQYGATIYWYWRTAGPSLIGGSLVTNKWYHLAITNDGINFRAYLDGTLIGATTTFGWNAATQIGIGGGSFGAWNLDGWVDDARVYDRCLTSEEIRLLARYRGIAYTPARRVIYGGEDVAAVAARPWLYRRSTRMIGA